LCVGINDYADPSLNLQFAKQDAVAVREFLMKQKIPLGSAPQIDLLTDEQATAANILKGLDDLLKKEEMATYVFYFSGRGHRQSSDKPFHFLSHDADPKNLKITGLKWSEVAARIIKLSEKGSVVVFIDTCFSAGAASENLAARRP